MNRKLLLLLLFPAIVLAEGQYILHYISNFIDLIKVGVTWFIIVKLSLYLLRKQDLLSSKASKIVWVVSGIIALFVLGMIKA